MSAAAAEGGGGGGVDFRRRRGGVLSSSERITGAKNAQADMILQRVLQQFQQELRRQTNMQQGTCFTVEHELKLLNIDRKCSELSAQRRLYPDVDHSHEEAAIRNLRRYLVQTNGVTSYTDKRLAHKLRTQAQPDTKTPVVARAQATLRRQANERAMQVEIEAAAAEAAATAAAASMASPSTHRRRARIVTGVSSDVDDGSGDDDEEEDGDSDNEAASGGDGRRRRADASNSHAVAGGSRRRGGGGGSVDLAGPEVRAPASRPADAAAGRARPDRLLSDSLSEPVGVRRKAAAALAVPAPAAVSRSEPTTPCAAGVGAAARSPPTQAAMREQAHRMNKQVIAFCEYIDSKVWDRKEEDFRQAIRFVRDKERAWAGFMDELQQREKVRRTRLEDMKEEDSLAAAAAESERKRRADPGGSGGGGSPAASARRKPISAATKKRLLLENILPARSGSAPSPSPDGGGGKHRRGMPWHTAERSDKHTPSMKLKMIIERTRGTAAAAAASAAAAAAAAAGPGKVGGAPVAAAAAASTATAAA